MTLPGVDDLDGCLEAAFRLLACGVADRRSPFRTPTLGTIGRDGAASLRTVVLRGFDAAERVLRLYTDIRSGKITEIEAQPRVAVHAYDPGERVQLQLVGTATLHTDDAVAEQAWAASDLNSRLSYAVMPRPGSAVPVPPPAPRTDDGARAHFAVIQVHFDRLEWLLLDSAGHRRALFSWNDARRSATWLVP